MNEKSAGPEDQPAQDWWSIVQAVAWIVERSDRAVRAASGKTLLRSLNVLVPRLTPTASGDGPPVSLASAPAELLRAARAGRIALRGRRWPGSEMAPVTIAPDDRLQDHGDGACVGGSDVYRGGSHWSDLWVRADECMARWPAPSRGTGAGPAATATRKPATDAEILAWITQHQSRLKEQRKPHGRDVVLPLAAAQFGIPQKLVRAVWDARRK